MVRKTQLGLRQTTDDRISVGMAPPDSNVSDAKFGDTPSTERKGRNIKKKISPDAEPITKVEKVMAKNKAKGIAAENLMRRINKPTQAERMADAFEGLRQAGKTKRGVITAGKMNQAERLAQTAATEQRVLARATTRAAKERATKLATKKGLSRILFQFGGEALEQSVKQVVKQSIGTLPLIGDLIGLILDITLFDQPVGRAAFMAGGSILGGIIGGIFGLIGGPPGVLVGSILGGISGDLLGGSFYDLIFRREGPSLIESGGQSAVKKLVKSGGLPGFFGGGFAPYGGVVHKGEFVFNEGTTDDLEKKYPGLLTALNNSRGSQVDEVLETYISYGNDGEGTETLVPIPFEKIITRTVTTSGGGEDSDDSISPFMDLYRRG
mgnify:CR=1 FL=1